MPHSLRAELDETPVEVGARYSRRPRIRCEGVEVAATRKSDALVPPLCRQLVGAGHDPSLAMEVYRGATLALRVRSIAEAARLTVHEKPVRFVPYSAPDPNMGGGRGQFQQGAYVR